MVHLELHEMEFMNFQLLHIIKKNRLTVVKNDEQILKFLDWYRDGNSGDWDWTLTFNWIMELEKGDEVRLQVDAGYFLCGENKNCMFNGKYIM